MFLEQLGQEFFNAEDCASESRVRRAAEKFVGDVDSGRRVKLAPLGEERRQALGGRGEERLVVLGRCLREPVGFGDAQPAGPQHRRPQEQS